MKIVKVAVGVVVRDSTFFICKRNAQQHQGGLWEFPGGKVEADEDSLTALSRELHEEIDITVVEAAPLLTVSHDYGDKQVSLEVFVVERFTGQAKGKEGQPCAWVDIADIADYAFPEANQAIIQALLVRY